MRSIRNCNVAVVGGAGFLGSHLVNHLIEDRGCNVLVIDNLEAGRREFVHPKAQFAYHDITGSEDHLANIFDSFGNPDVPEIACPDFYVFNYAARPYVPDSFDRPLRTFDVNAVGAMKVINAAVEAGCDGVLQVSSAELYGDFKHKGEPGWTDYNPKIDEDAPVVPHSSYGAAKAAIDAWIQVRWKEAKTRCIALRQFNCIGERETHEYIVPEIIGQLSKQKHLIDPYGRVVIPQDLGTGTVRLGNNSTRDFIYAGDAVKIAVELLEHGAFGECYNLGSESSIRMYDLAKMIGKLMGFADVQVVEDEARKRPWEIWSLLSCNGKIARTIHPKESGDIEPLIWNLTPLEEALKRTIAYYEANGRKWCWEK